MLKHITCSVKILMGFKLKNCRGSLRSQICRSGVHPLMKALLYLHGTGVLHPDNYAILETFFFNVLHCFELWVSIQREHQKESHVDQRTCELLVSGFCLSHLCDSPEKMRWADDVNKTKTLIQVFLYQHSQAEPLEVKESSQDDWYAAKFGGSLVMYQMRWG